MKNMLILLVVPCLVIAIGVSLILAPGLLGFTESISAEVCRVLGALIAAFATLSLSEFLAKSLRACAVLGFVAMAAPLWLRIVDHEARADANSVLLIAGLMVAGLSLVERPGTESRDERRAQRRRRSSLLSETNEENFF